MRINGKDIIIFASGLLAGTGLGTLISWGYFRKKAKKETDELLEQFEEEARKVEENAFEMAKKMVENGVATGPDGDVTELSMEDYRKLYSGEETIDEYDVNDKKNLPIKHVAAGALAGGVDYSAISGGKTDKKTPGKVKKEDPAESEAPPEGGEYDDLEEYDPEHEKLLRSDENYRTGWEATKSANSGKRPKIISGDDFYNSYSAFDECHLTFFTGDGVVMDDETEEEIHGYEHLIGDALDKYGFRDNDEMVIYVLNYSTSTKYEIAKCRGAYEDEITM